MGKFLSQLAPPVTPLDSAPLELPDTFPAKHPYFPFPLDSFQWEAIVALDRGKSVVVCAPTGSGKTVVGEYVIHRALDPQRVPAGLSPEEATLPRRVFYTTPLKALSNQKFRDFCKLFGKDRVGLLTGDNAINRDAPVVVMTTEIFRNMLYGTPIGEVGISLQGVDAVVLDECHYMNDPQRGTVWEESIIYCPSQVQLLALSATVENGQQLRDWLTQVHGETELIYSNYRPVPLTFHYCQAKGRGLVPLLNEKGDAINPQLKQKQKQKGQTTKHSAKDMVSYGYVLSLLKERDMLPAIYFIFSRRGCDRAVEEVSNLSLVDQDEAMELKIIIDAFLAEYPEAARAGQVEPLYRGIAAHHAGILPAWKGLVEELFQRGLIKVVFATETLAAGINMPARTTVISSLSKRSDRGHRLLTASEFLQMAGRAGRRGMDIQGHVVTIESPFESVKDAAHLATVGPDPLVSQFTPSYGMVLNLLQTHPLEEARQLVERSFGQYLSNMHLAPKEAAVTAMSEEVLRRWDAVKGCDVEVLDDYIKLRERLDEETRLLKVLQQQAAAVLARDITRTLPFTIAGTTLSLKGTHFPAKRPRPAVLVSRVPGSGQSPHLLCLTRENRWHVVSTADVVGLHGEYPRLAAVDNLTPPENIIPKPGFHCAGDDETAAIAEKIPQPPPIEESAPEVQVQLEVVQDVEQRLANHTVWQWGDPKTLLKAWRRVKKAEAELAEKQAELTAASQRYWQQFLNLMTVLEQMKALVNAQPTPLGELAAALRGDNELWLGLALSSGELEPLGPAAFAGVCAALLLENTRPDTWIGYTPSPDVMETLRALQPWQRHLNQQQRRYGVTMPVILDDTLAGLVEEWAFLGEAVPDPVVPEGASPEEVEAASDSQTWAMFCTNTSLDEGDIVRILRRTLDFLSQIPHAPHVSPGVKRTARAAAAAMNRFPVNEALP